MLLRRTRRAAGPISDTCQSSDDGRASCWPRFISKRDDFGPMGVHPRTSRRGRGTADPAAVASLADGTSASGPAAMAAAVAAAIDAASGAATADAFADRAFEDDAADDATCGCGRVAALPDIADADAAIIDGSPRLRVLERRATESAVQV